MGPHKADYKVMLHLTQYLWRLAAVGEMNLRTAAEGTNYAAEFELRNADEELKLTCAVDELEPLLAHDEFGYVEGNDKFETQLVVDGVEGIGNE